MGFGGSLFAISIVQSCNDSRYHWIYQQYVPRVASLGDH